MLRFKKKTTYVDELVKSWGKKNKKDPFAKGRKIFWSHKENKFWKVFATNILRNCAEQA